jgi:hypothetical protein
LFIPARLLVTPFCNVVVCFGAEVGVASHARSVKFYSPISGMWKSKKSSDLEEVIQHYFGDESKELKMGWISTSGRREVIHIEFISGVLFGKPVR